MSVSLLRAASSASVRRKVIAVSLIGGLSFSLAGCSAGNLTNFDFPSFGLLKNSPQEDAARNASSSGAPPSGQRLGNQ
ncbi:MAG: hypothetical protein VX871_02970 [Pseudomonadota bacterium]|nr:hypothetical protein [Pseudomonadota bacterium]